MILNEILSTLALTRLHGLSAAAATAAIRYYGSAAAVWADGGSQSERLARLIDNAAARREAFDRAQQEADYCQEHGVRILTLTDADYPQLLADCGDAPPQLFMQGHVPCNARHSLSVVGTRRITDYGRAMVAQLLQGLAEQMEGVLVVSGLAYGVDICAHRAALQHHLPTAAVLAHGLDRLYPAAHRDDAQRMCAEGGLLTEYFTHTVPDKGNFVSRNRIVAGMTRATLVGESADHGGALITARLAAGYQREVLAVPGRVTDPFSAGCNQLITQGDAMLVTCADDIMRLLGWEPTRATAEAPALLTAYTAEQERVLSCLNLVDAVTFDQLVARSGVPGPRLRVLLFELQAVQAIRVQAGSHYLLA